MPMYELVIKTHFASAHHLTNYHGKCERLHGHNWEVEVVLGGTAPDKTGLVIDFRKAKQIINRVIDKMDHQYLNKLASFRKDNPTTENIARIIYEKLESPFKRYGIKLLRVGVWESPTAGAYYCPREQEVESKE